VARPGVECGDVDAAARKVITDAGFGPDYKFFTHRLGHGIGMDGHEWPYLVRGNATKLQANMTFSDEPEFIFGANLACVSKTTCTSRKTVRNCLHDRAHRWKSRSASNFEFGHSGLPLKVRLRIAN